MLGTIEDLEKEIEQFQNNVAASGEIVRMLIQMLEQIKIQNENFEGKAQDLLNRVNAIPDTIKNANQESNNQIRDTVSDELNKCLQSFENEHKKYLDSISAMKSQMAEVVEQLKLTQAKAETFPDNLKNVNRELLGDHLVSVDATLEKRNKEFGEMQGEYVISLNATRECMENSAKQLDSKYKEFLEVLEKTNISNIYDQNAALKTELNKRTIILMVISGISVLIGVIGLFL